MVNFYFFLSLNTLSHGELKGIYMKMIITIDIDKDWIRREAESYKEFFTGYINQISGLKVLDVELIKEKAPKRRK